MNLLESAKTCKKASYDIMNASGAQKNEILQAIANHLENNIQQILVANQKDIQTAQAQAYPENMIDRMMLNEERMKAIIQGVRQVCDLEDPVHTIINEHVLENGLQVAQMRVALGVVGMIYEARPNVTVDAAVLCIKSGNAVMLRGSKDILQSNLVLVEIMRNAITSCHFPCDIITLVEDTTRETAQAFMRLNGYLDVLIPRGGAALIKNCVEHASVPLLETGTGNCHIYIDEDADFEKAYQIIINAKTQRTSVCNACESILLHREIAHTFAPKLLTLLKEHGVIIHGDAYIASLDKDVLLASEEDYAKEYLALEISIACVDTLQEAISHINTYSTHHSETIMSENAQAIQIFLSQVDSACVYANASTRFSDGFEFGLGAEIGISTQKLHARGPMGLEALTTLKYLIQGEGQIR